MTFYEIEWFIFQYLECDNFWDGYPNLMTFGYGRTLHDLWLNCLRHFIKFTYLHVLAPVHISHVMKWLDRFLKSVNIYFLNFYLSHLIRKFTFWFFFPITHLYRYNAPLHVYHIYIWKWQESEESMYIDMWYVLKLTAWFGNTVDSNLTWGIIRKLYIKISALFLAIWHNMAALQN